MAQREPHYSGQACYPDTSRCRGPHATLTPRDFAGEAEQLVAEADLQSLLCAHADSRKATFCRDELEQLIARLLRAAPVED